MLRTIMIADVNEQDRIMLRQQLCDAYEILEAKSGEKILTLLKENYFILSAIILDIFMLEKSGYEVLQEIRSDATYLDMPVIIITSDMSLDVKRKSIEYGANGLLSKPVDPYLMKKSLENVISIRENAALVNTLSKDRLTGMISHELFFDECDKMIQSHEPGHYMMSCIDIDNFKVINDQYGMETGDEVLKHLANCISICYTDLNGLACRFSADRFAVMYPAVYSDTAVILENHKQAISPGCINHSIRIRIGRCHIKDRSIRANMIFERATVAEESIKGRYDVYVAEYSDEMRNRMLHEQKIVNEMEMALQMGEFIPFLQPQFNHATGAMIGAEALVRWKKEDGYIPPGEFIPIFEKNGFIYNVDKCIWEQICQLLKRWLDAGVKPLPVSVNISRLDLYRSDFFEVICGLVVKYSIPTELLRLEVTESAFADSPEHILKMVNQLLEHGFTVEIDDFGSGYSSLNTLKDVPATILKLDMKFFSDTENSERSGNIIESVVRMAKWLGMAVIAEGVETLEQADFLKSIGCYYIQGYFYARPMTIEEYENLLNDSEQEYKLTRLKTIATLDNSHFWNPKSIETLIFNSYVGGACIFEYYKGNLELLRVNQQFFSELSNVLSDGESLSDLNPVKNMDDDNLEILKKCVLDAIDSKREALCELVLNNHTHTKEYVRFTMRMIANTDERMLLYCVIVNITTLREAQQQEKMTADKLRTVLKHIENGINVIVKHADRDEFIFSNDKYYEIFGYSTEEYHEKVKGGLFSIIYKDDVEMVRMKNVELSQSKEDATVEFRVLRSDHKLIWIKACVSYTSLYGIEDPVQVVVFIDITKEKEV